MNWLLFLFYNIEHPCVYFSYTWSLMSLLRPTDLCWSLESNVIPLLYPRGEESFHSYRHPDFSKVIWYTLCKSTNSFLKMSLWFELGHPSEYMTPLDRPGPVFFCKIYVILYIGSYTYMMFPILRCRSNTWDRWEKTCGWSKIWFSQIFSELNV